MSGADADRGLFPALLRHWRRSRGLSQLDLALAADVSARHISFLETGRSRPSREMVVRLSSALGIPLRHTDQLLRAAGHATAFDEPTGELPESVLRVIEVMGDHHEPFPMFVLDRCYQVRHANQGARRLLAAVLGGVPIERVNLARATFDPDGAQPFLVNFDEVGRALLWRIQREVLDSGGDPELRSLLDDLLAMPTVEPDWRQVDLATPSDPVIVVHLRRDGLELRFLTSVTSFSAPQNVEVAETRIEAWFPADEATAALCNPQLETG